MTRHIQLNLFDEAFNYYPGSIMQAFSMVKVKEVQHISASTCMWYENKNWQNNMGLYSWIMNNNHLTKSSVDLA
jgi:hypothetical protein